MEDLKTEKDFIEKVNSYADLCKLISVDPELKPDVSAYSERNKAAAISMYRLWNANEAAWGDTEIDWNDRMQRKYEIYAHLNDDAGSGSGFSYMGELHDSDNSTLGSRLVWPSSEIGLHVFNILAEDFRNIMKYPEK